MKKDNNIYIDHILTCLDDINNFVSNCSEQEFYENKMMQNACIRSFEVIGEASKRISLEFRSNYPQIAWKKIAGFRDVLIHDYEGIDIQNVWYIIQNDISALKSQLEEIQKTL